MALSFIPTTHPHSHSQPSIVSILRRPLNLHHPHKLRTPHVNPPLFNIDQRTAHHIKVGRRRRRRHHLSASLRQDTTLWTSAPLSLITPAGESLYHVSVDVSDSPDLASSHTLPGQYLQLLPPGSDKPAFLAIASPPSLSSSLRQFQFLVKSVPGSPVELLCRLRIGSVVQLSMVMGKGFNVAALSPPESFPTVLIFATGSGISPIRSLIESGFGAEKRADVRLYYGARNLQRMAYQDKFEDWESSGVRIIPVLSQPDDNWKGERGYVQAAFSKARELSDPSSTGAVLCGQKQMAEEVTSILVGDGVLKEKILMNF